MKKILSNIDVRKLPAMFYKMRDDLIQFYNANIKINELPVLIEKSNFKIYFYKKYPIDLWGWSGLDQWFGKLLNSRKNHPQVKFFQNIQLDPTLCLRQIKSAQGKRLVENYWNENVIELEKDNNIPCTMAIVDKIPNNNGENSQAIGKYNQNELLVRIVWNEDLNSMIKTLAHQLVHLLDQLTAYNLQNNLEYLHHYITINQTDNNFQKRQLYTEDPQNKVDHIQGLTKQFHPILKEILIQTAKICQDMDCVFKHYYLEDPEYLTFFSYALNFNLNNKQNLTKNDIINKINQSKYDNKDLLKDYFDYLLNLSTYRDYFDNLISMKQMAKNSFLYTINTIINQNKIYFYQTQLSKEILG